MQAKLFNQPHFVGPHYRGGLRREYRFPNLFGASLIPDGRRHWELAVLDGTKNWALTYTSGITGDVIPGLSDAEAEVLLQAIAALPATVQALPEHKADPMDAKGLVNALIAFYAERSESTRVTAGDVLIHAYSVAYGVGEGEATEFVADEIEDRRAARG